MTNTAAYTPLESLLLFQSLLQYGVETTAFAQISSNLRNNGLIRDGPTYDASRLSPESLQELFLQLLRDELKGEDGRNNADKLEGSLSPNSKKRKLQTPPLPTLQEARLHLDKLPVFVERLYARYRDHVVRSIREDERRFDILQKEIQTIEKEAETVSSHAGLQNGAAAATGQRDGQRPNGAAPSPIPTAVNHLQDTAKHSPVPQAPGQPVLAQSQPAVASRSASPAVGPMGRESPRPPNAVPHGLQLPQGAAGLAPRPTQGPATPQPPVSESQQRADGSAKHQVPVHPGVATGQLKWEPPYQPQSGPPSQPRSPANIAPYPLPKGQPPARTAQAGQQQYQGVLQQGHAPLTHPHAPSPLQQPQAVLLAPSSTQSPQHAGQHLAPRQPTSQLQRPVAPEQTILAPAPLPPPHNVAQSGPPRIPNKPPTPNPPSSTSIPSGPPQQQRTATTNIPLPVNQVQSPAITGSASPAPPQSDSQKSYSSPYNQQRPAVPEHLVPQRVSTPTPLSKARHAQALPQTPLNTAAAYQGPRGTGTRWKSSEPTPSTPRPEVGDIPSPAFEPLSPPLAPADLPSSLTGRQPSKKRQSSKEVEKTDTAAPKRGRPLRSAQKARESTAEAHRTRSPSADEASTIIKDEEATPRPHDELRDLPVKEAPSHGRRRATPGGVSSRAQKRKRAESEVPVEPSLISAPPTHVLWTKGFPRISASALDQIGSHRHANMFANKIRDRDAPGYSAIVRRSVDLKSIRMAINHGNKAAVSAAAALPEDDSGGSSVWLPISEDIVPPRGIINSSQLECELVHMFSNAIMYNPDSNRGPGPAFMIAEPTGEETGEGDASVLGYKVDEDGVVNDTRAMYVEVEKLLSDMRAAEKQRGVPPLPAGAAGITRQESVAIGDDPAATEDDGEAATPATDTDGGGTIKKRRITRG